MMQLAFILTMPRNNSWNGRWSGDERLYVIVKSFRGGPQERKAAKLIETRRFGYDFRDGWYANVEVRAVDASEARRLRSKSNGFCGYDWMVRSILDYGEILNDLQIAERHKKPEAVTA